MSEEVKIVVRSEMQGNGISEAERQLRALKEQYQAAGAQKGAAEIRRKSNTVARADQRIQQEIIGSTSREATAERASGNTGAAVALEREVAIRQESLRIQKQQGLFESDATTAAKAKVENEEKITASMAAQAAQEKAATEAAKATADALKAQAKAAAEATRLRKSDEQAARKTQRDDKASNFRLQRSQIVHLGAEAAGRHAMGDEGFAKTLEREAAIRKESLRIQMQTGAAEADATALANAKFASEERIAAAKAQQAATEKAQVELAAAQLSEQKRITKELAEQAALQKANQARLLQGGKLALNVGLQAAGASGGGAGPAGSLAGMAGGPQGLAIAAIAAATIGAINYHFSEQKKDAAEGFKLSQERGRDSRDLHRIEKYGTADDAAEAIQGTEDDIAEKKGKREQLDYAARPEWYDPRSWSNKLLGTHFQTFKGQRDIKENEDGIARDEGKKKKEEALAKQMWKDGPEGEEIEAKERSLRGDLRGAQVLHDKIEMQNEYRRVLKATHGDEATARHAADVKIEERRREEAQQFGGLVNARSGQGDIARAASLAHEHRTGADTGATIESLHRTMKEFHSTAKDQHRQNMEHIGHNQILGRR